MKVNDLSFNDIKVGDSALYEKKWNEEDVLIFSQISGDINPLHIDSQYASTTKFKKRIIHGMLVASTCSTLVGVKLPGKKALYLSQNLLFKQPVFIGDTTITHGIVLAKSESTNILTLLITVTKDGVAVVQGEAKVQVLT